MTDNKDKLLDHDYDGIKELDNDLPRWWLYLFYFTIAWAVVYFMYFHVMEIGYLQEDEYKQEMNPEYVRISDADAKLLGLFDSYHSPFYKQGKDITPRMLVAGDAAQPYVEITAEMDTALYLALTTLEELTAGKDLYVKNCLQCHGGAGEGGIGPNLTDKYWLHGGDFPSVIKSIKYGYPAKGMISWRGFLKEDAILQVGSYVQTLQGINPPNAKPPQGELFEQ